MAVSRQSTMVQLLLSSSASLIGGPHVCRTAADLVGSTALHPLYRVCNPAGSHSGLLDPTWGQTGMM